jgi:hypothetical protein
MSKYLPTRLAQSLQRTILDISTLLKILPDRRPLCFCLEKVTKFIISFGQFKPGATKDSNAQHYLFSREHIFYSEKAPDI